MGIYTNVDLDALNQIENMADDMRGLSPLDKQRYLMRMTESVSVVRQRIARAVLVEPPVIGRAYQDSPS